MTGFFALLILVLHGLWWVAVFTIGSLIVVGAPIALVAFIVSRFTD